MKFIKELLSGISHLNKIVENISIIVIVVVLLIIVVLGITLVW